MLSMRVLVVDDDRDFNEGLAALLTASGHRVESAFSGRDAIERHRDAAFDLALIDVKMPGMNGVESFLEIRKIRPAARVIMMTGYSVDQLLRQALQGGAYGVLHKPFEPRQLFELVERVKPTGVLIADDDPDFVASLQDALRHHGYTVAVAHDGQAAVERVRSDGVDVLILDLRMPLLNGLEVCLELRRTGRALPTIIVTAYAEQERDVLDTLETLSVVGVLTKPFDPRQVIELIEKCVPA